ncbi:hypothetical protein D3C85_649380 [compost metagenome]
MVPMKALVGFNLHGVSAAAEAPFSAPNADVANSLEAAGVAERVKGETKAEPKKASAPLSAA